MNCCNDMGTCTQGRDCPVRKQRQQETNDAYINQGRQSEAADPYIDVVATFKGLIVFMGVVVGLSMIALAIWGK